MGEGAFPIADSGSTGASYGLSMWTDGLRERRRACPTPDGSTDGHRSDASWWLAFRGLLPWRIGGITEHVHAGTIAAIARVAHAT